MKNIFFIGALLCSIISYSQSLGYNDLGTLITDDDNNGTARFRGMSGAFGSLGGDMSAIGINPAGTAVFMKSEFSTTMGFREENITSIYYGTGALTNNNYSNLSQAGAVFVFNTGKSTWSKTAIGFNYNTSKNFESHWIAQGNSNYPTFIYDDDYTDDGDDTNDNIYLFTDGQTFDNYTDGRNDKYTFSFASQYSDNLFIGASFITNDVRFYQSVYLEEDNNDGMGNYLTGKLHEKLLVFGNGFSFNLGIISKPSDNIRIGLSYQSPTWHNLTEEFDSEEGFNGFQYSMTTPSKTTGSFAFIFSQAGLISMDYAYRNYSNIDLRPSQEFSEENQIFATDFRGTSELRIGTEWRVKKLSFRGGYHYQQSPYLDAPTDYDLKGFSAGIGINFGPVKLDVAYEENKQSGSYDFYPQYDEIDAADLQIDNSKITATIVFKI